VRRNNLAPLLLYTNIPPSVYPALYHHLYHEFFKRDFSGASGLFSFVLKDHLSDVQLSDFLDNMTHFSMAYSWGGFESLILANQPKIWQKYAGIGY